MSKKIIQSVREMLGIGGGPQRVEKLNDVFGVGREIPLNYVERSSVDGAFIGSLGRDKHVVIYGSSKQGKTTLRKYCLRDNDYIVISCSNKVTAHLAGILA